MKFYTFAFLLVFINASLYSQSYISVQGHFNYWQHTDVFGPGIGFGYQYKISKLNLSLNYDYGYGSINRINNFDNINFDNWSTVFIKEQKGKWNKYLGFTENEPNEIKGSSDYGKQHQLSIQFGYSVYKKDKIEFMFSLGLFGSLVEHFYTFTNIPIHYIELPSVYSGPLNYIPATSQRIATYGINFEISLNKTKNSKVYGPFISVGIGPNYGSYSNIGMRLNTQLLKRKKV